MRHVLFFVSYVLDKLLNKQTFFRPNHWNFFNPWLIKRQDLKGFDQKKWSLYSQKSNI